jgi:hypothetical protein
VTPDPISAITGAPQVCVTWSTLGRLTTFQPEQRWSHVLQRDALIRWRLRARAASRYTTSAIRSDASTVVMSHVLPVLSLTMITMDKARCLYALLTETTIDYGSVVTVAMMSVRHADSCTTLPYGALITRIIQHARVDTDGMIELAPEKGLITASLSQC